MKGLVGVPLVGAALEDAALVGEAGAWSPPPQPQHAMEAVTNTPCIVGIKVISRTPNILHHQCTAVADAVGSCHGSIEVPL